ncbi:MAG: hypothetical protein GY839_03640 [candidate division Zixibacteria bacterium]|nr:hypothetical protein [candidate division Zixibacteria bacterium]
MKFKSIPKELLEFDEDRLGKWLLSFIKYGNSAPFNIRLSDAQISFILPPLIDQIAKSSKISGGISKIRELTLHALEEVLIGTDIFEKPGVIANMLDCFKEIKLYEGLQFLLEYDEHNRYSLERIKVGNISLRRRLLYFIFNIPKSTSVNDDTRRDIESLAHLSMEGNEFIDEAFIYLLRASKIDGWEKIGILTRAYQTNESLEYNKAIKIFFDKCTTSVIAQRLPDLKVDLDFRSSTFGYPGLFWDFLVKALRAYPDYDVNITFDFHPHFGQKK